MRGRPRGDRTLSADWEAVYRAIFGDVVRYLYRRVWDPERAQELAQEAFVRVLAQQRRADAAEVENPRALVFAVAGNLARDEARTVIRRKKHLALLKSDTEATTGNATPDPAEAMERDQERQRAQDALLRLGERDREVLLLWDAGLSYEEIAAQTGLAQGAIGTTLSRARRRLVAAYESMEGRHAAR